MVEDIMLDKPLQSLQIKKIVLKGLQITGVTIIYWMIPTAFLLFIGTKRYSRIVLRYTRIYTRRINRLSYGLH